MARLSVEEKEARRKQRAADRKQREVESIAAWVAEQLKDFPPPTAHQLYVIRAALHEGAESLAKDPPKTRWELSLYCSHSQEEIWREEEPLHDYSTKCLTCGRDPVAVLSYKKVSDGA